MRTVVEVVARPGPGGRTVLPVVRARGQLAVRRTGPSTVHLVATAFGPLGGDDAEIRLVVEEGAALTVRTVAAAVALPARDGRPSLQRVTAEVGGRLDLLPEPTVVAAGAHHRAELLVLLAEDARVAATEQVLLGRNAEAPGRWTGTTRVERAGRPVLHTTTDLGPGAAAWLPPVTPRAYVSTVHIGEDATTATATGDGAVRLPLAGGWVATGWGDELHRVVAEVDRLGTPALGGERVSLVVRARRVVLPDGERAAAVHTEDGRITAVTAFDDAPVGAVTLADDEVLLPGMVDSHVHVNDPGRTEWEGFASATRAAAAGGVTTIVDMPLNSIPPTTTVEALHVKREVAQGQAAVDVAFWGGAVPGNVDQLRPLHDAGVVGFKCFLLDSGVPEFPPLDDAGLREALTEIARFDGLLIAHAEDPGVIEAAPDPTGESYAGFLASRPAEAETSAIDRLVAAAGDTGARVHVVHLAAADALPALRTARADGVRITVETCPHYLTFAAEQVPDGATAFKCCPPIREQRHRDALWEALRDGEIDLVVSDHSPCTPDLKRLDVGDFGLAWGGIAGLQVSLPVVWTGARERGGTLAEVVRWMSEAPARLAGLSRKGGIAVGKDADLVAFAPDATFTVGRLEHRNPVTPYAGLELDGVVRRTWVRGQVADGVPSGRLLDREN